MSAPHLPSAQPSSSSGLSPRPAKATRWLIAGSIGILLAGGGFLAWRFLGPRGPGGMAGGMPLEVPVQLETVQTGLVRDSSEFLGRLEAQTGVVLQPEVSGRVTQVFATAGARVAPGDDIVLISPDRTQAEVDAAAANVGAAESAQQSAAASLQSLLSRKAEIEAELALEQAEFERTQRLVAQGAQSQQALDLATRDLEVARATLASAQDEIAAAQANLSQSEAALNQARANQAAAQQNLQDRTVRAPIAGQVGDIGVKLGDYVTPNSVITNITENASLELDLQVPIEQRDRLQEGLPVELLSITDGTVITTGSISFISPQTNADTQTVLVKARFDNAEGGLQDAQQVEARLVWSQSQGVLVPTSAITRIGGKTFVYIADAGTEADMQPGMTEIPEQVARLQPVELGDIQDNNYEILSGLESGKTVVVSGILNLRDGMPIKEQEPEANGAEAN